MNTIAFPRLGIEFPLDNVALRVFGLEIYWYGILIALSFLVAILLALRSCPKFNVNQDHFLDVVILLTPVSLVGARIFYVVFSWDEFSDNWLSVFNTRRGGLAIYGGVIAALLVVFIYSKVKKIDPFSLLDHGITYLPLGQAIGRWGNFVNQEAYGINTNLPWGMTGSRIQSELAINAPKLAELGITVDPLKNVHPTFLYESLWNVGVFLILLLIRKNKKLKGEVVLGYAIFYGLGRAWIEGLRTDSLMAGNFRISQILSIVAVLIFGALFIIRRIRHGKKEFEGELEVGSSEYGAVLKRLSEDDTKEDG